VRLLFPRMIFRLLRGVDPACVWTLAWNMGVKGARTMRDFERRSKTGECFPPFLFLSLTHACNLRCQGCWARPAPPPAELSLEDADRVIEAAKRRGCRFFGLLGGEPLLYEKLFRLIERHPDCYFQVFTNGTLLTREAAERMRELRNVTPLISVEGLEEVSDLRRGGRDVYAKTMEALRWARQSRLFFGVATSVCRSNWSDLVADRFLEDLIDRGVHYLWYYIYRPVGPDPAPELCLSADEIVELRRFMVEARSRLPLLLLDAYWDDQGRAVCPAAMGISLHINPTGDIEPCPPIQFSKDNLADGPSVERLVTESSFLREFRTFAVKTTRGCVLLEDPSALRRFVISEKARDTTGRGTGLQELGEMATRPGHHQPGREIPEKSAVYRWAKRKWFFGFGAYG